MKTKFNLFLIPIIFIIFSSNCGKNNDQKVYKKIDAIEVSTNNKQSNIVSAEQGGTGFEDYAINNGWETNLDPKLIGDPRAIKGGTLKLKGDDNFPPTFRTRGQDTRWQILSLLEQNVYQSLLNIN